MFEERGYVLLMMALLVLLSWVMFGVNAMNGFMVT